MGHVMNDCPSQWAYIATKDGGHVSASDVDDVYALATNLASKEDKLETDIDHEEELSAAAMENYSTLIVQRVLSTQMDQAQ